MPTFACMVSPQLTENFKDIQIANQEHYGFLDRNRDLRRLDQVLFGLLDFGFTRSPSPKIHLFYRTRFRDSSLSGTTQVPCPPTDHNRPRITPPPPLPSPTRHPSENLIVCLKPKIIFRCPSETSQHPSPHRPRLNVKIF